jgi:hypothetical protein
VLVETKGGMKGMENIEPGKTAAFRCPAERLVPNPNVRLRKQFHEVGRFKGVAARSEEAYWARVRRFLRFHKQGERWRHRRERGAVGQ